MELQTTLRYETRIIVPVRNGGARWREAAAALSRCVPSPQMVAVVDSTSSDGSDAVAADCGFELQHIDPSTFNHGRTRQDAVERFCAGKRFVIFLTHDAVIEGPESLTALLSAFKDPRVGAAYGRQLPHRDSGPFGAHSASFLYPDQDEPRTLADVPRYGIRTAHLSNSFAAYRIAALTECGGFPSRFILGEDAYLALNMLVAGWGVNYCAGALVRHSHDYSIAQEMQRYFDYGVFHAQSPELLGRLGEPKGHGTRYVRSELRYIAKAAPGCLPEALVRNAAKYIGYRLGRHFLVLPNALRRRLSMTKGYWDAPPLSALTHSGSH
jgi:rhamnosyltransferase